MKVMIIIKIDNLNIMSLALKIFRKLICVFCFIELEKNIEVLNKINFNANEEDQEIQEEKSPVMNIEFNSNKESLEK